MDVNNLNNININVLMKIYMTIQNNITENTSLENEKLTASLTTAMNAWRGVSEELWLAVVQLE